MDGELLANNSVRAKVYRGLVEVFARGIETQPPPAAVAAAPHL